MILRVQSRLAALRLAVLRLFRSALLRSRLFVLVFGLTLDSIPFKFENRQLPFITDKRKTNMYAVYVSRYFHATIETFRFFFSKAFLRLKKLSQAMRDI